MAGILGLVAASRSDESFPKMLRFASLFPWYETKTFGNFAACGLKDLGACVVRANRTLIFYGELFNAPGSSSSKAANYLLDGLETRGRDFLAGLEGRFQAALWDDNSKKLSLFCDQFATRPLYWTQTRDAFLFAPQIKTLLQHPDASRSLDCEALVDFFTWGQYFHSRTSLSGIELLPPGAFFTWDALSQTLVKERYFSFTNGEAKTTRNRTTRNATNSNETLDETQRNETTPSNTALNETIEAIRRSILQQTEGMLADGQASPETLGISLSGGLDARSILGMIPNELQKKMTSVALGVPGSADHRLASQLAQKAGTRHFNYELNTDFLSRYDDFLTEMVRLTDGQYLSSSIVIPTLQFYREKNIRNLLRGHAGELFHLGKAYAFSMKESDRSAMANGALSPKDWAFAHLQAFMLDGVKADLFRGMSRAQCADLAKFSLNRALEETGEERENAVWRLYLSQRVFREIPLSMRKFDSHVNVRLPFLNRRLIETVFRLPSAMRMGETIQKALLERWRPDFLKVRNVNTGTFIGAGVFRQKTASLRQRILAKLNVPGYQPYEKMGLWLRQELKPLVHQLLLKDGLRDRNIFNPDAITEVVRSHNAGENRTYLILALLIIEKQMRFLEI